MREESESKNASDSTGQLPPTNCQYVSGQIRCPLQPSMQVMGKWFCREHNRCDRQGDSDGAMKWLSICLQDPRAAQASLESRHWSDVLMDEWIRGKRQATPSAGPSKVWDMHRVKPPEIAQKMVDRHKVHSNIPQNRKETQENDDIFRW